MRPLAAPNARATGRAKSCVVRITCAWAVLAAIAWQPSGAQGKALRQAFPRDTTPRARMQAPRMNVVDTIFSALGTEPFWAVTVRKDSVILTTPKRPTGMRFPAARADTVKGEERWRTRMPGHVLELRATRASCSDSMSDTKYSHTATVVLDGRRMRGCGGRRTEGPR